MKMICCVILSATVCVIPSRAQVATPPAAGAENQLAAPVAATMLRLRDGSIQWGSIQTHDPEGVVFVRLDTGGRVRLPWAFLHPEEERDLRTRFGYVDVAGEEILIDADHIVTVEGAELTGVIIDRSGDMLLVKTSSATIPVPKNRLAGAPTIVQVPATEVFTRAELYAQALSNADVSTAEGQFNLARWCERILDFGHAVEHYKKATALDGTFRPEDLRVSTERALAKAARQDQVDYLSDIDALIARRRYDDALARADAFKEKFPDSPLLAEAKKARDRSIKARDKHVAERVATLWFMRAGQLARQMSAKMGVEEIVSYVGGQMSRDILDYVSREAQNLTKEATPEEVKKLWQLRRKVRWNRASYGQGTWLLGRDAALKGNEPTKDETKPLSEKDKERADLQQKLERYLKNQELARKAKTSAEQKDDREAAWKELSADNRASWTLAYYCETSGDFEVDPKPTFTNCRECGGEGTRTLSLAGGNVSRGSIGKGLTDTTLECPTCHGLGVVRRISYR
ncbi:MAG: hypothetical protein JNL28_04860 [Planctomycetes bacterium]|nr:hypothetical protein [Planctomycetota bacterium]